MSRRYYNRYGYGDSHNQRILRAFEQPLQLLRSRYFLKTSKWEIHISSSTGQGSYELNFTPDSGNCSCPDFERRRKPCKHMLCVLLRILKLKDQEFTSVREVGNSYEEITKSLLKLFHYQEPSAAEVKEEKRKKKEKTGKGRKRKVSSDQQEQKKEEEEDKEAIEGESSEAATKTEPEASTEETCIICLLDFLPTEDNLTRCKADCQRLLGHKDCLNSWFDRSNQCPLCKGRQASLQPASYGSNKRYRHYSYYSRYDEDEVDITALQANSDSQEISPAFFEVIRD